MELTRGLIFCYRGVTDKNEHEVGFSNSKEWAGIVERFYCSNEGYAASAMKADARFRLKVLQAFARTTR